METIDLARREWIEAVNTADLDRYAEIFAENGLWFPPGQQPIHSREAFRGWLEPFFAQYRYRFELDSVRCVESGGVGVEMGEFLSELTEKGAENQTSSHRGRYLVWWRLEEDGQWRIERYADITKLREAPSHG